MSSFISRTAGIMAQMNRANLDYNMPPRFWSHWWGDDTPDLWSDGTLWPNSTMQGGSAAYLVATHYDRTPRENGGQHMLKFVGITRDSTGAVLGNATVQVYLTANDQFLREVVSDAGGYFELPSEFVSTNHYLVAYKAGSPDVTGATVNTLQPA